MLLNNTFYNDPFAIQTIAPQFNGTERQSRRQRAGDEQHLRRLVADRRRTSQGQAGFSQLQYNLFFNNATNLVSTTNDGDFGGNDGAVYGEPQFVGPVGAAATRPPQNFELEPTSPAIDAAAAKSGRSPAAMRSTRPSTSRSTAASSPRPGPTPPRSTFPEIARARSIPIGGFERSINDPQPDRHPAGLGLLQLPRRVAAGPDDRPRPVITSADVDRRHLQLRSRSSGQRDILGYIRAPQAGSPGVGFGSNPFIDIGAYQYVNLHPPEVTAVTADRRPQGATPVNFYTVGGSAGANQTPWTINITFNGPIDPNTLNANTVQLVDLGSNPAAPLDQVINLAGKLSYNSATDTLIINLAAAGLTLAPTPTRSTLFGSGSPVITNPQGIALDGENTVGDTPTGAQLALPSGNGYPGGNFFDSFIINTTPPSVLAGSLKMDPASDTNIVGDNITNVDLADLRRHDQRAQPDTRAAGRPDGDPRRRHRVVVNGVADDLLRPQPASEQPQRATPSTSARTPAPGMSDAGGNFPVTVGIDAANTGLVTNTTAAARPAGVYNVGPDGLLSPLPGDDSGYYVARVRVIDQSGNQSNPTDPNAQVPFVVDTTPPTAHVHVARRRPGDHQPDQRRRSQFTITTSENIDLTHFTAASIR